MKLRFEYDRPAILCNGWKSWMFAYGHHGMLQFAYVRLFGVTLMIDKELV